MNIDQVAIYGENTIIYWSSLIIALGVAAGFFLSLALYSAHSKDSSGLWVSFPIAVFLSLVFCRLLHWYCHEEQYKSIIGAFTDFSNGSYCIQGVLLAVPLSVRISKLIGTTDNIGRQLDATAPGIALTIAIIRLSSFFNSSCRSKYIVEKEIFQRLPFAVSDQYSSSGEFRFATFFVEFILMMIVCLILIHMYYSLHNCRMKKPTDREGNIYKLFVVMFGGVELVLDSTRNDSSFLHFPGTLKILNKFLGFISVGQLVAAVSILLVLIYYMKCSASAKGKDRTYKTIWILYAVSLAMTGGLEYCVQRWSNYFRIIYAGMSVSVILMMITVFIAYNMCVESYAPKLDEYE